MSWWGVSWCYEVGGVRRGGVCRGVMRLVVRVVVVCVVVL